jgi:hypothetical protein
MAAAAVSQRKSRRPLLVDVQLPVNAGCLQQSGLLVYWNLVFVYGGASVGHTPLRFLAFNVTDEASAFSSDILTEDMSRSVHGLLRPVRTLVCVTVSCWPLLCFTGQLGLDFDQTTEPECAKQEVEAALRRVYCSSVGRGLRLMKDGE